MPLICLITLIEPIWNIEIKKTSVCKNVNTNSTIAIIIDVYYYLYY